VVSRHLVLYTVMPESSTIDRAQRSVALLVAGCFFMEMLDGTIVTTSAPKIAHALHVPVGSIALVITAYLVTLAVLIPLSAWMAARFGGRSTFLAAITLFTLASAGCAAATSFPELVGMRVLQGVGAAMMVPVGRLLVLARADPSKIMRLTALLVWPGLVAPVFAPLAGGLITTYASWHWLFLINLPLGLLALLVAVRIVHPQPLAEPGPLDVIGLLLTSVALGGLTFTAHLLSSRPTDWALTVGIGVTSLVSLVAAVLHLRRVRVPLVDLRLTRIHSFRSALTGSAFHFTAMAAAPFLVPLLFEDVFHWSAVKAGSLVLFIFVGNVAVKPATTYLYTHFGFRKVLIVATAALGLSFALLGVAGTSTPVVVLVLILLVSGAGRSVGATGYSTVSFSDIPQGEMRHANTLLVTVQQLSASWGVAVGAIALRLGDPIGNLFGGTADIHTDYTVAFILVGCLAFLATAEALRMHPSSGDTLRGEHAPAAEPQPAGR
jgi:EmrB/QacA subfamily drug resistance transporter